MEADKIITDIMSGHLDNDLDAIRSAMIERNRIKGFIQQVSLRIGDRVRMNDHCRPRYLIGTIGTIVNKKRTKVVVKFDNPPDPKWRGDVTCATSLLTLINAKVTSPLVEDEIVNIVRIGLPGY